jgi:hypothetical protein
MAEVQHYHTAMDVISKLEATIKWLKGDLFINLD